MINTKKQYIYGAAISYCAIAFNILSGLLYTPWMINKIGPDSYALYTLATSVISIFLLDFGIGGAVTKFLSNYYARGEYNEADKFISVVYRVFIVISFVIACVLLVFYFMLDGVYVKLSPSELKVFKNLFIIVSVYSVISFPSLPFNGVLLANELIIDIKLCNFGQKFLNVLFIVIALILDGNVYSLVVVNAVSNLIFVILKYALIKKKTALRADLSYYNSKVSKELFGYSMWMTVMSISQRLILNIMPTLIAALIGSVEVTIFSIAVILEAYVFSFTDAINGMFMPRISRIVNGENAEQKLSELMCIVGKFHIITLGVIYLGFLCIGKEFIGLWMGNGYENTYYCALLIIFPSLLECPQQVAKTALLTKDVVKEQAYIYVIMAVCNVVVAALLLKIVGVVGAGIAVLIAYTIRFILTNVLYKKKLNINLKHYFLNTYLRWGSVFLISYVIFISAITAIPFNGWMGIVTKGFFIVVVYIIFICIAGLTPSEKKFLLTVMKGMRRNVQE